MRNSRLTRAELGRAGEEEAARHLHSCGYRILARNWRVRAGEIDIIAEHDGVVVFVEVKTRTSDAYGFPEEAVTPRKVARLRALAGMWLDARPDDAPAFRGVRLDVMAIEPGPSGWDVRHVQGVG